MSALGYIAGFCTTFSGIPQIVRCFRTKSAKDLSYASLFMTDTGVLLWAIYGGIEKDVPLILWNTLSGILASTLIVMKYRFEKNPVDAEELGSLVSADVKSDQPI